MVKALSCLKLRIEGGSREGEVIDVETGPFTIGRDQSADLFLDDPAVSRLQAAIIQRDSEWILQDLGGRNPPAIHGRPVVSVPLTVGDVLHLGHTRIRVEEVGAIGAVADRRTVQIEPAWGAGTPRRAAQFGGRSLWEVLETWTEVIRNLDRQDSLVEGILDGFLRVIPGDRAAVYQRDRENGTLAALASVNFEGEEPLDYSETMVARVIKERAPKLFSPDTEPESMPRSRSMIRKQIRTAACFPLISGNDVWGIVYLDQVDPERPPLLSTDVELGTLLAHWVAEALEKAERFREMDEELLHLRRGGSETSLLVGDSPALAEVRRRIRRVAKSDVSVLVTGESGTGKELVAGGIHRLSDRKGQPFIAINCAAIPENLLESELFGYAPRSGIHGSDPAGKPGRFEQASGGTIFLDEIGEMPLGMQAKLLRVLEEGVVNRIGAQEPIPIDVRVVAATNRDLQKEAEAGRFREDLYYRLRVFPISIPPLRERPEDILPVAQHLLENLVEAKGGARVSPRAIQILRNHSWPGNVRELKNVLVEALLVGDGRTIAPRDLPSLEAADAVVFQSLREIETVHIQRVLEGVNWNKKKAADLLGIHRSTLYEKIAEHDLKK